MILILKKRETPHNDDNEGKATTTKDMEIRSRAKEKEKILDDMNNINNNDNNHNNKMDSESDLYTFTPLINQSGYITLSPINGMMDPSNISRYGYFKKA